MLIDLNAVTIIMNRPILSVPIGIVRSFVT